MVSGQRGSVPRKKPRKSVGKKPAVKPKRSYDFFIPPERPEPRSGGNRFLAAPTFERAPRKRKEFNLFIPPPQPVIQWEDLRESFDGKVIGRVALIHWEDSKPHDIQVVNYSEGYGYVWCNSCETQMCPGAMWAERFRESARDVKSGKEIPFESIGEPWQGQDDLPF